MSDKKPAGITISIITVAVFAAVIWWLSASVSADYLLRVESRSLFLDSSFFLSDCLERAAGLLAYAGCFLTQFLVRPGIGALIAVALWCAVILLSAKTFHSGSPGSYTFALIPAAAMVAASMGMGYMIFLNKLQGWFFAPAVGYLFTLFSLMIFRRTNSTAGRTIFIIVWTAIGYPLFGFYALLGTVAMCAMSVSGGKGCIPCAIAAILASAAIPLLWSCLYTTGRMADSYLAGLPDFPMDVKHLRIWIPYLILTAYTLTAAVLSRRQRSESKGRPMLAQLAAIAVSAAIIWSLWFKDENFRAELKMGNALERQDWKAVAQTHLEAARSHEASDRKAYEKRSAELAAVTGRDRRKYITDKYSGRFYSPTRQMVMYKNLALLKLGTAGSSAWHYKDGGRTPAGGIVVPAMFQSGKQIYFNYGLLNNCYRWCIEDAVEYGWNVESLKYAIRSSLVLGNWDIAEKYISKLKHAPLHRKWASEQRKYLHNPAAVAKSAEYGHIVPLICRADILDSDKASLETFLIKYFNSCRPENATPEFDDAAMMWAMTTQDIPSFWKQFSNWISTHPTAEVPLHYQEAACLYGHLEKSVDISRMPFSPNVTKGYDAFAKYAAQHQVENLDEMSYIYGTRFGSTFYYFYYFIRGLQTY